MNLNISIPSNATVDLGAWKQPLYVRCLLIIGYGTVFLLNIIGNPLVCLVVAKNKSMRTVTNFFIVNVAVSDFFVGGICMPFTIIDNLKAGWIFGEVMCTVLPMLMGMAVVGSVYTLVTIAIDRYLAVMKPTDGKLSIKATLAIIASIWLVACATMIPSAMQAQYKDLDGNPTCYETWPNPESKQAYTISLFVICYLVPLSVISGLYLRAGLRLYHRSARRSRSADNSARKESKLGNNVRVFKMMVAVVVLFACLHLPLWIATLLDDLAPPTRGLKTVLYMYAYPVSHWLAFANSCMNPILYAFLNRNFRQGFQKAFMAAKKSGWVDLPKVGRKQQGGRDKQDTADAKGEMMLGSTNDSRVRRTSPSPATAVYEAANNGGSAPRSSNVTVSNSNKVTASI